MQEVIHAKGHENILSTHKTTVEFTKDKYVTHEGNCIIALCADKVCADLSKKLKNHLRAGRAISVRIECDEASDIIKARGHPDLTLRHKKDAVIRKSSYIDDRTLAIGANKASKDLKRSLVKKIQKGNKVVIKITF